MLLSFRRFCAFFSQKGFEIYKILQKYNIFSRNVCYFAVVMQSLSNLINHCSLFTTVRYIFWDQWEWPGLGLTGGTGDKNAFRCLCLLIKPPTSTRWTLHPTTNCCRKILLKPTRKSPHKLFRLLKTERNPLWTN